jgi:dATP pyrophosphohydrolase
MPRAPFQVLVLPYRQTADSLEFGVLSRADDSCWQGIAGGAEDRETPLEAAKREAREEAGIPAEALFIELQAMCSIPVYLFRDGAAWGDSLYVIPEYSFGVDCTGRQISLAHEHSELQWLPFDKAGERLTYDSNRTALWELHQKLRGAGSEGQCGLIKSSIRTAKRRGSYSIACPSSWRPR